MKRNVLNWFAALAVAATVATPSLTYAMNGAAPLGYGIKSQGMGGVGVALPQDSLAAATNPAGMWMVGCRWDVGLGYVFQEIKNKALGPTGALLQSAKSTRGLWFPEVGINWNFVPCQSLGLAIYNMGSFASRYKDPMQGVGLNRGTSDRLDLWAIMPSWSWHINCIHSVGVAFNLVVGTFEAKGFDQLVSPIVSAFPNQVTNNGVEAALGANVRLGWIGQLSRCFRLGATFQTKTWMQKFSKYQGLIPREGEAEWPYEAAVGFAWDILPCLTLGFDYKRLFWAGRRLFGNTLNGHGGVGNTGTVITGVNYGLPAGPGLGWNDQSIYKVGLAYQWCCLVLRVGYNYGRNPIYRTETAANRLTGAVIENHVTAGATWKSCFGELSAFYWHGFKHKVRGFNSSVIILGQDSGNNYNISNNQNAVGVGYGRCF